MRTLLTILMCAKLLACSPESGDVPNASGRQFKVELLGLQRPRVTYVFVVDDREGARPLREQVATLFKEHLLDDHCSSADPASWEAVDDAVVIVRPSATGEDRFITPWDNPQLRFQTNRRTETNSAIFGDAVRAALLDSDAEAGAPHAILEAFYETHQLANDAQPRHGPKRQALATLLRETTSEFIVASAHDDESERPPSAYAIDNDPLSHSYLATLIVPAQHPAPEVACATEIKPTTARFAEWLSAMNLQPNSAVQFWPCTELELFADLHHCNPAQACFPWPPDLDVEGRAECVMQTHIAASEVCPSERGWFDPLHRDGMRRPRTEQIEDRSYRVCEVRQLEGAALRACRESLDCTDCEPGWCWTQVPELAFFRGCPAGIPAPFRLVHGAGQASNLTIACNKSRTLSD